MARTRRTDEEHVVNYFRTAPIEAAQTVYNIVRGIMRERTEPERKAAAATKRKSKTTESAHSAGTAA